MAGNSVLHPDVEPAEEAGAGARGGPGGQPPATLHQPAGEPAGGDRGHPAEATAQHQDQAHQARQSLHTGTPSLS